MELIAAAVIVVIGCMVLAVVLWAACTLSGRLSEEEEQ